MVKVLYIQSAPLSTSKSYIVAQEFIKSYKAANPDHQVVTWDLFAENGGEAGVKVPLFLQLEVEAKFGSFKGTLDPTQQKAWDEVLATINFFKSFDRYIFSVPMWNFGIPHVLKNFIDVLVQPAQTFAIGEGGYSGLITGKPALLVFARGGVYPAGAPADFQQPYLEFVLKFIGFTDLHSILVEGQSVPSVGPQNVEKALEDVRALAKSWPATTKEKN